MENLFKFKKPKKMFIGGIDPDDQSEWCLLTKPVIGDATLFVHFQKLWCVTESPEIEADPDNGIEGQDAVVKQSAYEVYIGFVKDGKFVVERTKTYTHRVDEAAQRHFLQNLEFMINENGYIKDEENYYNGAPIAPEHYGRDQPQGNGRRGSMNVGHQMIQQPHIKMPAPQTVAVTQKPDPKGKLSTMFDALMNKNNP